MKIITIIPARAGSKSIPKKNIQLLDGKPLLAYSIEYSLRSKIVGRTIVSTDSDDIANLAVDFGADVPFIRPSCFAEDVSVDYEFMRHALDYFEAKGEVYDAYVLLRPTSPLRPIGLIEKAALLLEEFTHATSIRSMAPASEHPYRIWAGEGPVYPVLDNPSEPYNMPRQSLPKMLFQTGDLEMVRRSTLLNGSVSGDCVFPLLIDHQAMVDIDNWNDLKQANERLKK
jgi:CMP-N,N'-diacetyllegionaminic acid synthase